MHGAEGAKNVQALVYYVYYFVLKYGVVMIHNSRWNELLTDMTYSALVEHRGDLLHW